MLEKITLIKRDGTEMPFERDKIRVAIAKSFIAVGRDGMDYAHSRQLIEALTADALRGILRAPLPPGNRIQLEAVQDHIELALMREGVHDVARAYIIYRDKRARDRAGAAPALPVCTMRPGNTGFDVCEACQ